MNYLDSLTTAQQVMTLADGKRHIAVVLVGHAITDAEQELALCEELLGMCDAFGNTDPLLIDRMDATMNTIADLRKLRDKLQAQVTA